MNPVRHYVRIDSQTDTALDEIRRYTFATKSALMRHYIRDGVRKDTEQFAAEVERLRKAGTVLASVS